MTIQPRFDRRRLLLIGAVLSGAGAVWPGAAQGASVPAGLKKLLEQFQKSPGIVASFEEDKNISLLAAPLTSSGQIYFRPPHSLARIVDKPRPSHLVMTGKKIVVKEGSDRREVDLSDKPALRGLIGSLLHVLAGDEKKLLQDFDVHFSESGESAWSLELEPKDATLKRMVTSFYFEGTGLTLSRLRVKEANGDETVTNFLEVNTAKKFSKNEIARIFDI